MNKQNAVKLGQFIGEFVQLDEDVGVPLTRLRRFIRIRATVDTRNGLKAGCFITRDDDSRSLVLFKYERLPEFCYVCGKIDHTTKACPNPRTDDESKRHGHG